MSIKIYHIYESFRAIWTVVHIAESIVVLATGGSQSICYTPEMAYQTRYDESQRMAFRNDEHIQSFLGAMAGVRFHMSKKLGKGRKRQSALTTDDMAMKRTLMLGPLVDIH